MPPVLVGLFGVAHLTCLYLTTPTRVLNELIKCLCAVKLHPTSFRPSVLVSVRSVRIYAANGTCREQHVVFTTGKLFEPIWVEHRRLVVVDDHGGGDAAKEPEGVFHKLDKRLVPHQLAIGRARVVADHGAKQMRPATFAALGDDRRALPKSTSICSPSVLFMRRNGSANVGRVGPRSA